MKPALLALPLAAACTSLVPSTAAQLRGLSPLEADPARIEVAMSLPQGLDLTPQGALLTLSASHGGTGEETRALYVLDRRDGPGAGIDPLDGGRLVFYRIAPGDRSALRDQQARIRAWKAESAATSGSLQLSLAGCRAGNGPEDGARGAVWIRTEVDGDFMPLIRPSRISAIFDGEDIASLPPCG